MGGEREKQLSLVPEALIYNQLISMLQYFKNNQTMLPNKDTPSRLQHHPNVHRHQIKTITPHLSPNHYPNTPFNGKQNLFTNNSNHGQSRSGKKSRKGSVHKLFAQAHRTHLKQTFLSMISPPRGAKSKQFSPKSGRTVYSKGERVPACRRSEILQVSEQFNIKIDPTSPSNDAHSSSLSRIILQLVGEKLTIAQLSSIREIREECRQVESQLINNDSFIKEVLARNA